MGLPTIYDRKAVAVILGVSPTLVGHLVKRGRLKVIYIGQGKARHHFRVTETALMEFIKGGGESTLGCGGDQAR